MKKCYIAGQITYLSEEEYKANFDQGKKEVARMGYLPVSPLDLPHDHGRSWSEFMKEDLRELLSCDCVYALSNWHISEGAKAELDIAQLAGLEVVYQANSPEFTNGTSTKKRRKKK